MIPAIAVTSSVSERIPQARELADELHFPFLDIVNTTEHIYDYLLTFTSEYLGLTSKYEKKMFYIDFLSRKLQYRSNRAGLRNEGLAKAIHLNPRTHPVILDATAGLGRDSYILATLGFQVIMLERSPILYALLRDALLRIQQNKNHESIIKRLQLIHADATDWLPLNKNKPDVIYLDPMFPERKKKSLVRKEMVILQQLVGKDEISESLLQLALTCAHMRVVVKRPRLAAAVSTQHKPNYSIIGKSSRFDVYLATHPENGSETS